jgi:Protein of unknown function (DUF3108)
MRQCTAFRFFWSPLMSSADSTQPSGAISLDLSRAADTRITIARSCRLPVRCAVIGASIAIVLAIEAMTFAGAHAQGRVEAQYTASIAGIPIGTGTLNVAIGQDRFTAAASGRVSGLLRAVVVGDGSAAAHGTINAGRLVPERFSVHLRADQSTESVRIGFDAGVVKEIVAEPELPPSPDRVPVTAADRDGVTDPMTAALMPVDGSGDVLSPTACQRTLAIFDGRQRFDLALSFKRLDQVEAEDGFRGSALVCAIIYRPISGHRPSRAAIQYLMEATDMEAWMVPITGTRVLVPFRIALPTPLGRALLEADQFVTMTGSLDSTVVDDKAKMR